MDCFFAREFAQISRTSTPIRGSSVIFFLTRCLPSLARLTRAAEGIFIVEDVGNIGPNYDPTLLAWQKNFRRAWPLFADRYGERFRRMWRFYLLSCAGAFRAGNLQVFSILFSNRIVKSATAQLLKSSPLGGSLFRRRLPIVGWFHDRSRAGAI